MIQGLGRVKLMVLDVDGTMTSGGLQYGDHGSTQVFSARDGAGIMQLIGAGIKVAFVSLRDFRGTRKRAADLGVKLLCLGSTDKAEALRSLSGHLKIGLDEILFIGDDVNDLPAMELAGFSACPSDAAEIVRKKCSWVSSMPGGKGAVRELADMVLEACR